MEKLWVRAFSRPDHGAIIIPFLLMMLLPVSAAAQAPVATVQDIRFGMNGGHTRFVMEVSAELNYSHMVLPDPYRVVLDLPVVEWNVQSSSTRAKGHVSGYRYGLFSENVSRLVLDLKGPAQVAKIFTLPKNASGFYRLVVDIEPVSAASFEKKSARSEPVVVDRTERQASLSSPSMQSRKKKPHRTIVLDAGHGGVDPGTISVIGVKEKHVVLDMARAIQSSLGKRNGFQVHLTRDRDFYIPHRQRYEKARKLEADLFISVHADAIDDPKVRGATVYTLSERGSDREAEALARKENRSDLIAGVDFAEGYDADVTSILIDLAQRETMNYSARFATYLVPELSNRVLVRKNSHRFANFLVLKAPDVPSVLLEVGYLSNKQDSRMLVSNEGKDNISHAVAQAVARYFESIEQEGL